MPRRLWQSSCTHLFGDAMCQFDRSSLQTIVTSGPGSPATQIATAVAPGPAKLVRARDDHWLSGANAGSSRTVANIGQGVVYVKPGYLSPVSAGDEFQMLPGCDRTLATCTNVFNNAIHFGGFPYIPTPETAV